jgi:hypothetical protein
MAFAGKKPGKSNGRGEAICRVPAVPQYLEMIRKVAPTWSEAFRGKR